MKQAFIVFAKELSDALRDRLFDLRKKGFTRLYQNSRVFEFSTPESLLDIDFSQPVYALVDRIAISHSVRQRLVDTVEICYREAGEVIFEPAGGGERILFNEKFQCKQCGMDFQTPEPVLFSFNSPVGACKRCQGFGNTIDYDMGLVVPDRLLSIEAMKMESPQNAAKEVVVKKIHVAVGATIPAGTVLMEFEE